MSVPPIGGPSAREPESEPVVRQQHARHALEGLGLAAVAWIALAAIGVALEVASRLLVAVGYVEAGDTLGELGTTITATMVRALDGHR